MCSRPASVCVLLGLTVLMMTACQRDDTRPTVNPTIQFLFSEGYTFKDDTVGVQDTLLVGVVVKRGTDAMHHFSVTVSYDGGGPQTTDSLPMGTDEFEFDKVIVTREQPGQERWSFNVVENDGDVIRRSLTFVVEE